MEIFLFFLLFIISILFIIIRIKILISWELPKRRLWNWKMKWYLRKECTKKGFENLEEWERSLLLKFYAIEWDEDEEGNKIYNFHEKNN